VSKTARVDALANQRRTASRPSALDVRSNPVLLRVLYSTSSSLPAYLFLSTSPKLIFVLTEKLTFVSTPSLSAFRTIPFAIGLGSPYVDSSKALKFACFLAVQVSSAPHESIASKHIDSIIQEAIFR
jgi:hypothetical protein